MAATIRKNLTFFVFKHASDKNVYSCISPVSLSLSLHFFSTQTPHINPTAYEIFVHKHHFPLDFASLLGSELARVKSPETVDSMLSFLISSGFSIAQLQKILKYRPSLLLYSLERNIKPKIKNFQDEGFSSAEISKIIWICPQILNMSLRNSIVPSLYVLKELLGSNAAVVRVVRNSPELMTWNMKKTLAPNVEFLKSCGVSADRIRVMLNGDSLRVFRRKPEVIRAYVEKTKAMGLSVSSKAFIYAIQTIGLMPNGGWELKLQAFRDMGFSDSDILSMFRRVPRVFGVSMAKTKKVTELLLSTGKYDISSIVQNPTALRYSVEMRYEPRMRILGVLERKNLIENWPSLSILCHSTDADFYKRFVSPYLDHLSDVLHPQG